jgi:hypothetical protein
MRHLRNNNEWKPEAKEINLKNSTGFKSIQVENFVSIIIPVINFNMLHRFRVSQVDFKNQR